MTDIKSKFCALPEFCSLAGIDAEQINIAENALALRFADDYREYLLSYGIASSDGHEFTGICNSERLNVVDVTLAEKSITPGISNDWYVLEEVGFDGIIIWQSSTGEIFQTQPGRDATKIAVSICDYLGV